MDTISAALTTLSYLLAGWYFWIGVCRYMDSFKRHIYLYRLVVAGPVGYCNDIHWKRQGCNFTIFQIRDLLQIGSETHFLTAEDSAAVDETNILVWNLTWIREGYTKTDLLVFISMLGALYKWRHVMQSSNSKALCLVYLKGLCLFQIILTCNLRN